MKSLIKIIAFSITILPIIFFVKFIFLGDINFWYDSARDLLSAWDNLKKITLIGPPTGVSGIFYGPYWIWLLSLGLAISKNPRVVVFLISFIPISIIFPLILFKFSSLFKKRVILLTFLFFLHMDGFAYATTLWNPHIGLVIFLALIYLIIFSDFQTIRGSTAIKIFIAGIASGLMINFQMSLGICIFFGSFLFLFIYSLKTLRNRKQKKFLVISNTILILTLFLSGAALTFAPLFLFEIRHGFNQIHAFIEAFKSYGGVVNYRILSQKEILTIFFGRFGYILHTNWLGAYMSEILSVLFLFWFVKKKKINLSELEKKLLFFLFIIILSILYIYLTARNPVWEYHFLGTEVIFILLIAFVINKIPLLENLLIVYILYSSVMLLPILFANKNLYASSSLVTKEHIVDLIHHDAKDNDYKVNVYSPSIYVYDYTYLFKWRHSKEVPFDPNMDREEKDLVYLIIPKIKASEKEDFISYRTPSEVYYTVRRWSIPDGTEIIKRIKK